VNDVVIFGATGFTGRLVAEYVVKHRNGARVAIAGRDRQKLEKVKSEIGDVDVIIANTDDRASLDAMVAQTKVVCTTVGPYAKYGSELVAACAAKGVHYCDLTGEPQWVRRMIDAHHNDAKRTGARIVPACGFDSIPSDLGVHTLQSLAKAKHGAACNDVTFAITRVRGGASGGTIATMFAIQEEARADRNIRRLLADPYGLVDEKGPDTRDSYRVLFNDDLQRWTVPFFMSYANRKVVHRTNALEGYAYGHDFKYRELSAFRPTLRGRLSAWRMQIGMAALVAAVSAPPTRKLLQRGLAKPGEGPSQKTQDRGLFEAALVGRGPGFLVRGKVFGKGDPGYAATARMLGESALCLASTTGPGGLLTPAFAMGDALVERLRKVDFEFSAE
jgi:short subunit dehydrogenase-like uncharacterized protein